MMNLLRVRDLLTAVADHAEWQFAIGVRVRFANPTLLYQTYPPEWLKLYSDQAMIFSDPTLRWAIEHYGICRWADLADQDEAGVMAKAAEYGLRHGIIVSVGDETGRTLGSFCRSDRDLTEAETAFAAASVQELHNLTEGIGALSESALSELRSLNVGLRRDPRP